MAMGEGRGSKVGARTGCCEGRAKRINCGRDASTSYIGKEGPGYGGTKDFLPLVQRSSPNGRSFAESKAGGGRCRICTGCLIWVRKGTPFASAFSDRAK